ncbi:MAG: type II secretion system protein GspM [Gammaproteobacteria bacterium]|nr:type II secretion system protein GspM [Gammaproteobacteria bacterium]
MKGEPFARGLHALARKRGSLPRGLHALLSIGITLILLGALSYSLLWPALSGRAETSERLAALHFQQQRFSRLAHSPPAPDAAPALQIGPDPSGFLAEQAPALAAAHLQQVLGALVTEAGGVLLSSQALPGNADDSLFPAVTVKVSLNGSMATLHQVLYRIETHRPVLIPDNLLVQTRSSGSPAEPDDLGIRFDVTAFIYQPQQP